MVSKLTLLVGYTTREIQYTVVFKMLVTMWDPKPYQYTFYNLLHLNPLLSSFFFAFEMDHLENIDSLQNAELPNVDTLQYTTLIHNRNVLISPTKIFRECQVHCVGLPNCLMYFD